MNHVMAGIKTASAVGAAVAGLWVAGSSVLPAQQAPAAGGQAPARGAQAPAAPAAPAGAAQAPAYRAPRTYDKRPNLNGIWQANNSANWDLEAHSAEASPVVTLGAWGGIPAGQSVVVGGSIPYTPAGLKKRAENRANRLARDQNKADSELACFLPGIPRATYMPYPFQIVQSQNWILMAYEYDGAGRTINMDNKEPEMPIDTWMGYSWGRWEGESLVVETKGMLDRTWLDRAGNAHSDQLSVVERFTPRSADTLNYEATLTDPVMYTKPWTIRMPLYRRVEPNVQILEYNCVHMTEEWRYAPLLEPALKLQKPAQK